jgi:hypothetical protein
MRRHAPECALPAAQCQDAAAGYYERAGTLVRRVPTRAEWSSTDGLPSSRAHGTQGAIYHAVATLDELYEFALKQQAGYP